MSVLLLSIAALATAPPAGLQAPMPGPGPHESQTLQHGGPRAFRPPARGQLPPPTPGPKVKVYGYLPYWETDDLAGLPWDRLTDLELFAATADADGSLSATSWWDAAVDAVAIAKVYGVKVHLCALSFDSGAMGALLASSASRASLVENLVSWVEGTGADGVNLDFEGLPVANKQDMVDLAAALDAAVGDVSLATPAVDWAGAWDYSELSKHADLFVMGYDYHWSTSPEAGPVDPLFSGGGTAWSDAHSIAWSLDDYATWDSAPDRTILGLPLYGYRWGTSGASYPASALGTGDTVLFDDAWAEAATFGRLYDEGSVTPYYYDGSAQTWYGDTDSVRQRIQYALDQGIGGIGFWALHYTDDPAFWDMVGTETGVDSGTTGGTGGTGETGGSTDYVAYPGGPLLAYVGDTVVLRGKESVGPADAELAYEWTQVAGTPVKLDDPASDAPRFTVKDVGDLVFELRVGDGADDWSAPAKAYVVVIDPDAGERYQSGGCGCNDPGTPVSAFAALIGLALATRRRAPGAGRTAGHRT
jgi:hypothetical protein